MELTKEWMKQNAELIKARIPVVFPNIEYNPVVLDKPDILEGHAHMEKLTKASEVKGKPIEIPIKIMIMITVSRNLLELKSIEWGIKTVFIHEICHVVNPKDPDSVMKLYFPAEWEVWSVMMEKKILKCSYEMEADQWIKEEGNCKREVK